MLMTDLEIILPDIFLEKVDRASMASSVEIRVPFLDNHLIDFCIELPSSLKLKKGNQKYLLKKALYGIVPNNILNGPKVGFSLPVSNWIKRPLLKEFFWDNFKSFNFSNPNIFDERLVSKIFLDHTKGVHDYSFLLWKILNMIIWANSKKICF